MGCWFIGNWMDKIFIPKGQMKSILTVEESRE